MSGTVTYQLKHPLKTILRASDQSEREDVTTELTVRRIKGKDLRNAPTDEIGQALHLLARTTGLTPMQVDELDAEDIAGVGEVIEGFMPPGLKTGGTTSET